MSRLIWFLSPPVTAAQKAKALELGVRIVDAKFKDEFSADEVYTPPETEAKPKAAPKKKTTRKKKAAKKAE